MLISKQHSIGFTYVAEKVMLNRTDNDLERNVYRKSNNKNAFLNFC